MRTLPLLLLLLACKGKEPAPVDEHTGDPTDDTGSEEDHEGDPIEVELDEACNPLAMGDDCFLPYPSLHWTTEDADSPTGIRLAYHAEMYRSPAGALPIDPAIFNGADGVSPTMPALVTLGVDIDPEQLAWWDETERTLEPGYPMAILHAETGERLPLLTEMDANQRDSAQWEGRHALILRPMAPMQMGGRYIAVLTTDLQAADGSPLEPSPVFQALRDGTPTTSPIIEAMRPRYEELFTVIEEAGYAREDLLLAWEWQVASEEWLLNPIRSIREQVMETAESEGFSYTIDSVETDPNENVAWLIRGRFTPPAFIDGDNILVVDEQNRAIAQVDAPSYPFTLAIPPAARERGGLPLVVMGHGIFGRGEDMVSGWGAVNYVQPLSARTGAVIVATDWIGLSGGDLELIIAEVVPDLSRIQLVTDRLVQSLGNTLTLTELMLGSLPAELESDGHIDREVDEPLLDPDRVYYYGVSLGGVQGSSFASVSPRVSRAVVAVPGAGWAHMMQRSTHFSAIETLVDALYPDPLTQLVFLSSFQGFFDLSDPVNLATLAAGDPSWEGMPEKQILIQEGIGDCQVPNLATDVLVRALGAVHLGEATDPIHGVETVSSPALEPGAYITQYRLPDHMAAYMPPEENLIPPEDNDVHGDMVFLPEALLQVEILMEEGRAEHLCDGPCDPD